MERLFAWLGIALGGAVALALAFLASVWIWGGLRTDGAFLDWDVVTALASVVAAFATVGALAGVGYGVEQLRQGRRTERLALMPYLRVDVGFSEPWARHRGFTPPTCKHVFDPEDFGDHVDVSGLEPLRPAFGDGQLTLTLWVTNQQSAPLGGAYEIEIWLLIVWNGKDGKEVAGVEVQFTYVEPGHTTAIRLGRIRETVEGLEVYVSYVAYHGMFLDQHLRNRHGSQSLTYDAKGGTFKNERSFGLTENH